MSEATFNFWLEAREKKKLNHKKGEFKSNRTVLNKRLTQIALNRWDKMKMELSEVREGHVTDIAKGQQKSSAVPWNEDGHRRKMKTWKNLSGCRSTENSQKYAGFRYKARRLFRLFRLSAKNYEGDNTSHLKSSTKVFWKNVERKQSHQKRYKHRI